jgi:hypothetical protein
MHSLLPCPPSTRRGGTLDMPLLACMVALLGVETGPEPRQIHLTEKEAGPTSVPGTRDRPKAFRV